jgi:glutathione reductase (NADPH)
MDYDFDLIIIGTGTAGTTVADKCSQTGWKIAIIDQDPYGGTCALHGCLPKKVLVGAAEVVARAGLMQGRGLTGTPVIDWRSLISFKRSFTDRFPKKKEERFARAGITALHGNASFIGPNTLRVNEETFSAAQILIATGAVPAPLGIPGSEHVITSNQFLELESLPERIVFIGGGYVSFELAHIAARAGARVTIIHRSASMLRRFDPAQVALMISASREAGIEVLTGMPVHQVQKNSDTGTYTIFAGEGEGTTISADLVVHGAGRIPALEGLDLAAAGVTVDKQGIVINEYLQSISNLSVWVAGDANGRSIPLTPVAEYEGKIVAANLQNGPTIKPDYGVVASVVFTQPPLAAVGLNEHQAEEAGLHYIVLKDETTLGFTQQRIGGSLAGYTILIDAETHRILGATLFGPGADEMINLLAVAMKGGLTDRMVKETLMAYPTSTHDIRRML